MDLGGCLWLLQSDKAHSEPSLVFCMKVRIQSLFNNMLQLLLVKPCSSRKTNQPPWDTR